MSYPLRVGVSPGTTSLVIGPAGLGQVYLNPGSGPFAACPPDPAVKFAVDPWRPSTGFQPAGLRITMPSPSASTVLPTRTGAPVTVGGKPHLVFENVYGTASSLKGAGPSWKATALILGGAFLGGVGVALAVHFAKRSATPLMLRGGSRPYTKAEWARFDRDKAELDAIADDANEAYGEQADALWRTYQRKWDEFHKRHR